MFPRFLWEEAEPSFQKLGSVVVRIFQAPRCPNMAPRNPKRDPARRPAFKQLVFQFNRAGTFPQHLFNSNLFY